MDVLVVDAGVHIIDETAGTVADIVTEGVDLSAYQQVDVAVNILDIDAGAAVEVEITDGVTTVSEQTTAGETGNQTLALDVSGIDDGATITVQTTTTSTIDAVIKPIKGLF